MWWKEEENQELEVEPQDVTEWLQSCDKNVSG